jgi:hypothetical protein
MLMWIGHRLEKRKNRMKRNSLPCWSKWKRLWIYWDVRGKKHLTEIVQMVNKVYEKTKTKLDSKILNCRDFTRR